MQRKINRWSSRVLRLSANLRVSSTTRGAVKSLDGGPRRFAGIRAAVPVSRRRREDQVSCHISVKTSFSPSDPRFLRAEETREFPPRCLEVIRLEHAQAGTTHLLSAHHHTTILPPFRSPLPFFFFFLYILASRYLILVHQRAAAVPIPHSTIAPTKSVHDTLTPDVAQDASLARWTPLQLYQMSDPEQHPSLSSGEKKAGRRCNHTAVERSEPGLVCQEREVTVELRNLIPWCRPRGYGLVTMGCCSARCSRRGWRSRAYFYQSQ
ncbi:hypothetical protein KC349_g103 [Hortaea werneckii]|nr:hypothetical protein KC349_g103 [Hortaea werneckii]